VFTEIIGMVATADASESRGPAAGPVVDAAYLTRFARAHEDAGFDRVLIGYHATGPDAFAVAGHVLSVTTRLKVLIAHRPGFAAPTLVARQLATLDALHGGGRAAIHHITGGDEADQRRDGDFASHDRRYARTAEFMGLLRRELTATEPFDHEGEFYRVQGAFSHVRPAAPVPLYFGGASDPAVEVGAEHADVYMLWGEPVAQTAARIAAVRAAAARRGRERPLRFSLSVRPVIAATEDEAWARAERIRAATAQLAGLGAQVQGVLVPGGRSRDTSASDATSVGSRRLQDQAAQQEVHDERLWYGVTALTGPGGNSTALVGTAAQVAAALARYREAGVDTVLIRGFDPVDDVTDWGRELVPLLRGPAA
jgi:alkanesulfonate monooxygenase